MINASWYTPCFRPSRIFWERRCTRSRYVCIYVCLFREEDLVSKLKGLVWFGLVWEGGKGKVLSSIKTAMSSSDLEMNAMNDIDLYQGLSVGAVSPIGLCQQIVSILVSSVCLSVSIHACLPISLGCLRVQLLLCLAQRGLFFLPDVCDYESMKTLIARRRDRAEKMKEKMAAEAEAAKKKVAIAREELAEAKKSQLPPPQDDDSASGPADQDPTSETEGNHDPAKKSVVETEPGERERERERERK